MVDSNTDSNIVDPGNCTLRDAINSANSNTSVGSCDAGSYSEPDIINLSDIANESVTLTGAQLPIVTSDITFQGAGVTVDGDGQSRLFELSDAPANLTIDSMNMTGGVELDGGGIYAYEGTVYLTNSTVSENSAKSGGGIHAVESTVNLTDSTVSDNNAKYSGSGIHAIEGTINLTNSIIANSSETDCYQSQHSTLTTSGANLVEDIGNCTFTGPAPITNTSPNLGPLADNGGPTLTHLPMPGSPVIDAGDSNLVPNGLDFDQRGTDFDRIFGVNVDLGSVEVQPPPMFIFSDGFEDEAP